MTQDLKEYKDRLDNALYNGSAFFHLDDGEFIEKAAKALCRVIDVLNDPKVFLLAASYFYSIHDLRQKIIDAIFKEEK